MAFIALKTKPERAALSKDGMPSTNSAMKKAKSFRQFIESKPSLGVTFNPPTDEKTISDFEKEEVFCLRLMAKQGSRLGHVVAINFAALK